MDGEIEIEFKSITDNQLTTYHNQHNDNIHSIYMERDVDFLWCVPGVKEMKFLKDSQDENCDFIGTYEASNQFDIIKAIFLKVIIPNVYVSESFAENIRIRWTDNLAHNLIKKCNVKCSQYSDSSINSKWLDMNLEYLISNKELYSHLIGNRPELLEWTNNLESTILTLPLPIFNRDKSFAFPLYRTRLLQESKNEVKIIFKLVYRLEIDKLITMKQKVDGKWKSIETNLNYLTVSNANDGKNIKIPKMYGYYTKLSQDDINFRMQKPYKSCIENIHTIKSDTVKLNKNNTDITFNVSSSFPVKAIIGCVVNKSKESYNIYSDYGIKAKKGKKYISIDPIKYISFKYLDSDKTSKFDRREQIITQTLEYLDLDDYSSSTKEGCFYIPFSSDFSNFHNSNGIILENNLEGSLTVNFHDYCIGNEYTVELFLIRSKKIIIDEEGVRITK